MNLNILGARRFALREARKFSINTPSIEVEIRRGNDVQNFEQEVLKNDGDLKITLQVLPTSFPPARIDDSTVLDAGCLLIWYIFPSRWYEIGLFFDQSDVFLGHYINLIRPPTFEDARWVVEDLYLDVWAPIDGSPMLLDENELDEAVTQGKLSVEEARKVRELGHAMLDRAAKHQWPRPLRKWSPELVSQLRFQRDFEGTV